MTVRWLRRLRLVHPRTAAPMPLAAAAAALISACGGEDASGQGSADEIHAGASRMLASVFAREASELLARPNTTPSTYELSGLLLDHAMELAPDDADLVLRRLAVAQLAEDRDLQRSLAAQAYRLRPDDERLQLLRLNDVIDEMGTAEERQHGYEVWLSEANINRLRPAVASRLASDYAFLLKRLGDDEGCAKWIARASALDQTNKAAAAYAAGYYSVIMDDPFGQGELLVNLLLADPTDRQTHVTLGRHLLMNGAYVGASRFYNLAMDTAGVSGSPLTVEFVADVVMATWAAGQTDRARATLQSIIRELDVRAGIQAGRENPLLGPLEREGIRAQLPEPLAAVRLAMLDRLINRRIKEVGEFVPTARDGDAPDTPRIRSEALAELASWWVKAARGSDPSIVLEAVRAAASRSSVDPRAVDLFEAWAALKRGEAPLGRDRWAAIVAADRDQWLRTPHHAVQLGVLMVDAAMARQDLYQAITARANVEGATPRQKSQALLEQAWLSAWLDHNPEALAQFVSQAEQIEPLKESARARYEGWIALKKGELEQAEAILTPLAETDKYARISLALTHLQQNRPKEATRLLIRVWKDDPSTLLAIWCQDLVTEILDHPIAYSELSTRLEALAASVSSVVDRMMKQPERFISLQLEPLSRTVGPFDPILVRLTVVNNSSLVLGIGSDAPIHSGVFVRPTVTVAGMPLIRASNRFSVVVDLGDRLRLLPRERVEVVFDVSRYPMSKLIEQALLNGGNLELRATLNPWASLSAMESGKEVIAPGILGLEASCGIIRVDGANIDDVWIEDAIGAIREPDSWQDVQTMALLGEVVASASDENTPEVKQLMEQAGQTLAEAFVKLDPLAQGWLLVPMSSSSPALLSLRQHAMQVDNLPLRISWSFHQNVTDDDPVLLAMLRSEDRATRRFGEAMDAWQNDQERIREFNAKQAREAPPPTAGGNQ